MQQEQPYREELLDKQARITYLAGSILNGLLSNPNYTQGDINWKALMDDSINVAVDMSAQIEKERE